MQCLLRACETTPFPMHKYFVAIGLLLCIRSTAQLPEDALRASWTTPSGTAREQAIGGAMGSIGGDISAAFVNPAGLGLYKTNEVVISPGWRLYSNKGSYLGSSQTASSINGLAWAPAAWSSPCQAPIRTRTIPWRSQSTRWQILTAISPIRGSIPTALSPNNIPRSSPIPVSTSAISTAVSAALPSIMAPAWPCIPILSIRLPSMAPAGGRPTHKIRQAAATERYAVNRRHHRDQYFHRQQPAR